MIDLKFYVVSIVAVFLALALGILLGSVIVGQQGKPISEKLIKSIEADVERVRAENQVLLKDNQEMNKFLNEAYPLLIQGRLVNEKIGLVYFDSEAEEEAKELKDFLRKASARVGLVKFDLEAFSRAELTPTAQTLNLNINQETSFTLVAESLFSKLTTSTVDFPVQLEKLEFLEVKDFGLKDLPFDYLVFFLPSQPERLGQLAKANFDSGKVVMVLDRSAAESPTLTLPDFNSTLIFGIDTLPGKVALVFAFNTRKARLGYGKSHYFSGGTPK
jgi:hypothetical protein